MVLNQRIPKILLLQGLCLDPSLQTKVEILEMRLPKTSSGARKPLPERTLQIRNPIAYYTTYLKEYGDQISESRGVSPQHVLTSPPFISQTPPSSRTIIQNITPRRSMNSTPSTNFDATERGSRRYRKTRQLFANHSSSPSFSSPAALNIFHHDSSRPKYQRCRNQARVISPGWEKKNMVHKFSEDVTSH